MSDALPLDIELLKQAVAAEDAILFAYLFGSFATGTSTPLSDVDIAIYPAKKLDVDDRLGIIQRLGKKTRLDNLDVAFLDRLDNLHILEAIITQGIVLVDKAREQRQYFEVIAHHQFLDFQYQRQLYMGA